jgi:hypothetical protein
MDLLTPKIGLSNRYSVGGYRYPIEDLFWIWVANGYPVRDRAHIFVSYLSNMLSCTLLVVETSSICIFIFRDYMQ